MESMSVLTGRLDALVQSPNVAPVLPGRSNEDDLKHSTARRASISATEAEFLLSGWVERAERDAQAAIRFAEAHPQSSCAWTRAAHSSLSAGMKLEAVACSRSSLQAAQLNTGKEFDLPAAYGAARVLVVCGEAAAAAEYLARLTPHPMLTTLRANAAAIDGNVEEAVRLLSDSLTSEAASLRGYLLLKNEEHRKAIQNLRTATRMNPSDVDAHLNLACALYASGSPKKALRSAGMAWRLCPARRDVAYAYLELLWQNEKWQEFRAHLALLESSSLSREARFALLQARNAVRLDKYPIALSHFRNAEAWSRENQDLLLAAEAKANALLIEHFLKRLGRKQAWREILRLAKEHTDSFLLLEALAKVSETVTEGTALARLWEGSDASAPSPERYNHLAMRVAFLTGNFDEALEISMRWLREQPNNSDALYAVAAFAGHVDQDWIAAAHFAGLALSKLGADEYTVNQAAYSAAMAGRVVQARAALDRLRVADYYLEATRGLVEICAGELASGFRHYRKALVQAEKAATAGSAPYDAVLMYLHQLRLLAHINISVEGDISVQASALPSIDLPVNWRDIPSLLMLKKAFDSEGIPWPESHD